MSAALGRRSSSYYSAPVHEFLLQHPEQILGGLAAAHSHDLEVEQRRAWQEEIDLLQTALIGFDGTLYLEFDVPRIGSRIDAVLVSGRAPYHPTPTIIEAARALYSRHSVDAISRNDAGAKNLQVTSVAVEEIIDCARTARAKAIVFVTGVPGAGKTLVGLNVATKRREYGEARAVFLSGNGPLVDVLREALTRDELARQGQMARVRFFGPHRLGVRGRTGFRQLC